MSTAILYLIYPNPRYLLTTDDGFGPVEDGGRSVAIDIKTGTAAASVCPQLATFA